MDTCRRRQSLILNSIVTKSRFKSLKGSEETRRKERVDNINFRVEHNGKLEKRKPWGRYLGGTEDRLVYRIKRLDRKERR